MSFFPPPGFQRTNRLLGKAEWESLGVAALREIPVGTKDIFESFRVKILTKGFPEPEKDTWWGNLASKAISQGVLQMTKEVGHMKLPKSNGRRSPIYVRI
jgi:hypothetical protein